MNKQEIEKLREALENYRQYVNCEEGKFDIVNTGCLKQHIEKALDIKFEEEIPFVVGGVYEIDDLKYILTLSPSCGFDYKDEYKMVHINFSKQGKNYSGSDKGFSKGSLTNFLKEHYAKYLGKARIEVDDE